MAHPWLKAQQTALFPAPEIGERKAVPKHRHLFHTRLKPGELKIADASEN